MERLTESVCAHLEASWRFYAIVPSTTPALLIYRREMWNWVPLTLDHESVADEEVRYMEAVRQMTRLLSPAAVALVGEGKTTTGSRRLFATIEFRGEADPQTIVWDIHPDGKLINRQVAKPQEKIDYASPFEPPRSPLPPPPHADFVRLMLNHGDPASEAYWRVLLMLLFLHWRV